MVTSTTAGRTATTITSISPSTSSFTPLGFSLATSDVLPCTSASYSSIIPSSLNDNIEPSPAFRPVFEGGQGSRCDMLEYSGSAGASQDARKLMFSPPVSPTSRPASTSQSECEDASQDFFGSSSLIYEEDDTQIPTSGCEIQRQRNKLKRFRLTHTQTRYLQSEFAKQAHPDAAHRERLAREIPGLSARQVQVWFQNRRAKMKRLSIEDRESMLNSRALPENFDMTHALHSAHEREKASGSARASIAEPTTIENVRLAAGRTTVRDGKQYPRRMPILGENDPSYGTYIDNYSPTAGPAISAAQKRFSQNSTNSCETRSPSNVGRNDSMMSVAQGPLASFGDCSMPHCNNTMPAEQSYVGHSATEFQARAIAPFSQADEIWKRSPYQLSNIDYETLPSNSKNIHRSAQIKPQPYADSQVASTTLSLTIPESDLFEGIDAQRQLDIHGMSAQRPVGSLSATGLPSTNLMGNTPTALYAASGPPSRRLSSSLSGDVGLVRGERPELSTVVSKATTTPNYYGSSWQ